MIVILLILNWLARLWAGLGPWEEGTMPDHDICDQVPEPIPGNPAPADTEGLFVELAAHWMRQRCDRCGARHKATWRHGDQEIRLCGAHSRENGKALADAGWSRG